MEHEALVRAIPLLARLSEPDRRDLAARGKVRSYRVAAAIFREGDPGDSLHIVMQGSVRISVLSPSGEEATLALLGPGDCFGDLALLDGRPRSASAIAQEAARTLIVTRAEFRRWLLDHPPAAFVLLEELSLRLRQTDQALADFTFLPLPNRLARRLLELAAAHEAAGGGRPAASPRLRITQAELASMLGVSRESVNRQLNLFEREGWIGLGRGSVTLLDPQALERSV